MQGAKHSNAPGIASIRNAAARPYRVDSTDPISVIQWTSHLHAQVFVQGHEWQLGAGAFDDVAVEMVFVVAPSLNTG